MDWLRERQDAETTQKADPLQPVKGGADLYILTESGRFDPLQYPGDKLGVISGAAPRGLQFEVRVARFQSARERECSPDFAGSRDPRSSAR